MKKIFFAANVLFVLSLVACNTKQEPKTEETTPAVTAEAAQPDVKVSQLATNKDFACGMDLADGGIADTTTYEGKLYGFCSHECKEEFLKNPTSYLSQK